MRRIFYLFSVVVVSGCVTLPVLDMRDQRIRRYSRKNRDVSAEVLESIRTGVILENMTMEQVKLAWGEPGSIKEIPYSGGKKETIWYYYDKVSKAGGFDDASMFAQKVPSKRVLFNRDNEVKDWKIYDEELETSPSTVITKTLPKSVLSGGTSDGKQVVRAGSYRGWPQIVLSTIVNKGADGAAVINGRVVSVGDTIQGVKLLAVGSHGIKLRYNNQIGVLKKGESTR